MFLNSQDNLLMMHLDQFKHCYVFRVFTLGLSTLFENYSKCRIWSFEFWHFPPIFVLLNLTCLVTLFDRKLQVQKLAKNWPIFGNFNKLLSTQNVNVARFARNVEWDFFCDFQTLWTSVPSYLKKNYLCFKEKIPK